MMHRIFRAPLWMAVVGALIAALLLFASYGGVQSARAADEPTNSPQVIGGTDVPDGKYKFLTGLYDSRLGPPINSQFCGGTLIDKNSVLTAAHCVVLSDIKPTHVTVGRTVRSQNQGVTRPVVQIFVHPKWNPNTMANDAAVLKLKTAVDVTKFKPIKLATSTQNGLEKPGLNATVAGWGNTTQQSPDGHEPNTYPDRMREAQVPIVSDSKAEQVYDPIFGPSGYIPGLQVAAGKTGKDTCQGDSGGPLFAKPNGVFTQIGVTSWGIGCGSPGYPGVYAEVNNTGIRSFITNAMVK